MLDKLADERDRRVLARPEAALMRHTRWESLSPGGMAAAVAEVEAILAQAGHDLVLPAQRAGTLTGARFGWPNELQRAVIVGFIRVTAGAEEVLNQ